MTRQPKTVSAWVFVGLYAGVIFYLSSLSRPLPEPIQKYFYDWVLHGVEYLFFGVLLARAIGLSFERSSWRTLMAWTFVVGALYGISDEWHQSFVPEREACVKDAAVDAVAVLLGAWIWTVPIEKRK